MRGVKKQAGVGRRPGQRLCDWPQRKMVGEVITDVDCGRRELDRTGKILAGLHPTILHVERHAKAHPCLGQDRGQRERPAGRDLGLATERHRPRRLFVHPQRQCVGEIGPGLGITWVEGDGAGKRHVGPGARGAPSGRRRFVEKVRSLGLSGNFVFTGLVPPATVPKLVGIMDILAHLSLREGLARGLPQAVISGRPACSYDVDGAREVVISDATGFLIPPRDIEQLAARLTQLAADPALRDRLGQEGRRRFAEQFRHEYMTAQLRKLYRNLLAAAR